MTDTKTMKIIVELSVPLHLDPINVADELLDVLCSDEAERSWRSVDGTEPVSYD